MFNKLKYANLSLDNLYGLGLPKIYRKICRLTVRPIISSINAHNNLAKLYC